MNIKNTHCPLLTGLLILGLTSTSMAKSNYDLPPGFTDKPVINIDDLPPLPPPPDLAPNMSNIQTNPVIADHKTDFSLTLKSHSKTYQQGDTIYYTLRSNQPCYLTLLNIGTSGKTTVLFPNSQRPNNYIKANKQLTLPSDELLPVEALTIEQSDNAQTNEETITAICHTHNALLFNTPYTFDQYAFKQFNIGDSWLKHVRPYQEGIEARADVTFTIKTTKKMN